MSHDILGDTKLVLEVHTVTFSTYCRALYKGETGTMSGTLLLYHPHQDRDKYEPSDKALRDTCCSSENGNCHRFLQQRTVNKCTSYEGSSVCKL